MAAGYDSASSEEEEEDLPSLNELLASRRRTPAKATTRPPAPSKLQGRPDVASESPEAPLGFLISCRTPTTPHSTSTAAPRRSVGPSTPAQATAIVGAPSVKRETLSSSPATHQSLADELFPPSPPRAPSPPVQFLTKLYKYRDPSPSIISDSEEDLPSPIKPYTGATGQPRVEGELGRRISRESFWVEDSEDERVQESRGAAPAQSSAPASTKTPRLKPRSSVVYDLSSDPEDDECAGTDAGDGFGLGGLLIHDPATPRLPSGRLPGSSTATPRPVRAATPASRRRRITISILSSSSSSASSESEPEESAKPPTKLSKTPSAQKSSCEEGAEVLFIDDEDDEGVEGKPVPPRVEKQDLVVSLPSERSAGGTPIQRRSATPEREEFGDEDDPNDGVLVYEPTPRAKKPLKLGDSPVASPRRTLATARKPIGPSKRSTSIDLTGSSDSESENDGEKSAPPFQPPTLLFPPARGAPKPRLTTTAPATPALKPRPKQPKSTPSTPARKPTTVRILTDAQRESLPLALAHELDRAVFRKRWEGRRCVDGEGESTGPGLPDGIEIKWNKKLRNTAGRASWKRIRSGSTVTHVTSVDLATKVTDTEEKLRHTLAHELCHIAAWVLSGEIKPPHGDAFKLWASRIMSVRPDINITTTHSYEITYKFRWQCLNATCAKIFSRHSRSIDPMTQGCPCGARLGEIDADGQPKERVVRRTPAKKSGWQEFLAVTAPLVRLEIPGIRNDEVFKVVSERYRAAKEAASAAEREAGSAPKGGLAEAMERLGV